ncbi:PilZ domain-containing protein [Pseudomonas duriflava]|uniref:PilZ domain-containing protein n=1 Tax=Pseudomonas duriflava TaxID=459528 RepID=A0A562QP50_9PSED|nr:PilZ domain-containing protein [Pseudomonas duriflava]TWI58529.1 PilZ domain-containing protein [Pseudomonas duriflava]
MKQNRHIERHQLPYFLKVFNRFTDKPMGYLGNISLDGMLLISELPLLVSGTFELRLKVPGRDGQLHFIDFDATCQWSREDVTPGYYDSGFSLAAPPADYIDLVESLRHYFSFNSAHQSV